MDWHFEDVWRYREALCSGLLTTLVLNAVVLVLGTAAGCVLAALRLTFRGLTQSFVRAYVDFFRSLPLLVLLVWLFFALPMVPGLGQFHLSPLAAAVLGLSLNLSAFVAEIVRGGIEAVPRHHLDAAQVAGFTRWQTWRHVTMPIAFRIMVAPLFGQYINQIKLSVLASIIAVPELLHTVNTITTETFRPLELYSTLAALFLLILIPCTRLQTRLERRRVSAGPVDHIAAPDLPLAADGAIEFVLPAGVEWEPLPRGSTLSAQNLAFSYNGSRVLESVSVAAAAGAVTSLIGANGSGKTTLLKCLSTLYAPESGTVSLQCARRAGVSLQAGARIGYLAQQHEPWPHLSVIENLALPLRIVDRLGRDEACALAREWLRAVRLERRADSLPAELSGGEKQRLVLVRTLCLRPQILLLDEPTSAMDFRWALAVHRLLRSLADRGVLIVAISHGLGFLRTVANGVAFLDRGRLIESGAVNEVLNSPATVELRTFLEAA